MAGPETPLPANRAISLLLLSALLLQGSRGEASEAVALASPAECIAVALQNNLDLRVRVFEARRAEALLDAERGGFDPFAEFNADFQSLEIIPDSPSAGAATTGISEAVARLRGAPLPTRPSEASAISSSLNSSLARLVQPLPTGGEIALSGRSDEQLSDSAPRNNEAALSLSLAQPLLRGFAHDAARIPLKRARIDSRIEQLELRRAIFDLARDVEIAYWELVAFDRALSIAEGARETAKTLVEEAALRQKAGLADRVEIIEAESAHASREEAVLEARRNLEDQRDQLLALLGCLGRHPEPAILLKATPPPERRPDETELETMARIRAELPDYRIALQEIDRAKLDLDAARSDLLPQIDLAASVTYRGDANSRSAAFRSARGGSDREIAAGIIVGIPLTFREGRGRARAARMQVVSREAALARTEQDLRLQLRLARRSVETAPARIAATRAARLLAEERFRQLRALYGEGLAPLRDVLPAQDDMERARLNELRARLDAAIAAVELARIDATLLARNRIDWGVDRP